MKKYIMALDAGTTSARCILFDQNRKIVALAQSEITQYFPADGYVEQDPYEIFDAQLQVAKQAMKNIGATPDQISAIGITNQRETTIVWDKTTGRPVYNAIVWQCRRTAAACEELKHKGYSEIIRSKTGLIPDSYFSATKIQWMLDHIPNARDLAKKGQLIFGTVDSWLIYKLTGGNVHATDVSNASRTMIFNIHTLDWDDELLTLFDIPHAMLPKVMESSAKFGITEASLLGASVPICCVAGDQQAALF